MYEHGGHLSHVTWTIYINFVPLAKEAPHEIGFDWPSGFRGEDVAKICQYFDVCQLISLQFSLLQFIG